MKKQLVTAVALALGVGFGSAQAATIGQLTSTYPQFMWEDDDVERLEVDLNGNGLLDVGDTLRGIVEIQNMYDTSGGSAQVADLEGLGRTDNALAGIFETEVKSKTFVGVNSGSDGILGTLDDYNEYDFTFGAVGGALGNIVTFYEDNVDNLNITNCGANLAACEGTVTDGVKILELGFAGDPDEFWTADGVGDNTNAGIFEGQNLTFNYGDFNFGLSVLFSTIGTYLENQPTGQAAVGGNGLVQWTAGGTIKGTCTENGLADADDICDQHIGSYPTYTATSDADLNANRVVPEPTSIALTGLGLLAMGASLRRRRA